MWLLAGTGAESPRSRAPFLPGDFQKAARQSLTLRNESESIRLHVCKTGAAVVEASPKRLRGPIPLNAHRTQRYVRGRDDLLCPNVFAYMDKVLCVSHVQIYLSHLLHRV